MRDIKDFKTDLVDKLYTLGDIDNSPFKDSQQIEVVSFFKKIIKPIIQNKRLVIISDYDVDGFTSGIALETYLKIIESRITDLKDDATKIDLLFSTRSDGYNMPKNKFTELEKKYDFFVFLDTGSEYSYLKNKDNVAVIDHHPQTDRIQKNRDNILNPNMGGNVSTSTGRVLYEMIQSLEEEFKRFFGKRAIKEHSGMKYIKMLTSLTILSDMAELDYGNRDFLKKGIELINDNKKNFLFLGKIPDNEITAETLSFNLINLINSYSRMNKNLKDLAPLFQVNVDRHGIRYNHSKKVHNEIYKSIMKVHNERKSITNQLEKIVAENFDLEKANPKAIFIMNLEEKSEYSGINGLLAQFALSKLQKPSIVISWDAQREAYVGSGRGKGVKEILAKMIKDNALEIEYGGHAQACGVSINKNQIHSFMKAIPLEDTLENLKDNKIKETIYKTSSISDYKKACENYFYLCDTVGISEKMFCEIEDYDFLGSTKTKNGWNFITIKDNEDFLSFYTKSDNDDIINKNSSLVFEIKNSKDGNAIFLEKAIDKALEIKETQDIQGVTI